MTTFAENPVTFPDGQTSVIPFPEEVFERGFFPPVQTPDGGVIKGDVLAAPWINKLFQMLFRTGGASLPADSIFDRPDNGTVEGRHNWLGINIGPLTLEIGAYRFASSTPGSLFLQYGTTFKSGTKPLILMMDYADPSATTGKNAIWGSYTSATTTNQQFNIASKPIVRNEGGAVPGTFLYMVLGERDVTRQQMAVFCNKPQTFIDNQTSLSAPSNDQVAFGFVPPVMSGSLVQDGDTIPANVLNYILRDLTTIGGNFYWEMKNTVNERHYRIVFGDMQLQAFRTTIAAGNPASAYTTISFAWPFASTAVAAGLWGAATPTSTAKPSIAQAVAISNTQLRASVRAIDAANAAPNIGGTIDVFAFGKAATPALADQPATSLPGFAMNAKTYADGQVNKVKPVAAIMDGGFRPPYKNASGTIIGGDMVTANEINWLLDEAYKTLLPGKVTTGTIAADASKKITGGWWFTVGDLLIQYFSTTIAAGDWANNVRKQPYAIPVKTATVPAVFPVCVSADENTIMVTTATEKTTDSDVDVGAAWIMTGGQATGVGTTIQYLVIGKKA